jgi:hypothetical protein
MLLLAMTQTSQNLAKNFFTKIEGEKSENLQKKYRRWPCVKISTLKVYRWRQCVNILYPANLAPEAM